MRVIVLLGLAALFQLPAHAQVTWTKTTSKNAPPARLGHGMVWERGRGRALMYGGRGSGTLNDTWVWDGGDWKWLSTTRNPGTIQQFGMAYDWIRQRTLLFGGAYNNNTWEFDGKDWQQFQLSVRPAVRCCPAIAYFVTRLKIVMFGGYNGSQGPLRDMWEWDGKKWTKLTPKTLPPARCCCMMVLDISRNKLVLFGGATGSGARTDLNDTWEFDGTDWKQIKPKTSPPARRSGYMAYDEVRRRVVLFGGSVGGNGRPVLGDTWEWDGVDWKRTLTTGPSARFLHAVVYDRKRDQMMVFGGSQTGGSTLLNDTWHYHDGTMRADVHTVSVAKGGTQTLSIDAGTTHASRYYVVAGGFAGFHPGLKAGTHTFPINPDPYFWHVLTAPNTVIRNQLGRLDAAGQATAKVQVPPLAALVGLRMHHACGIVNLAGTTVYKVSGPVRLNFTR